MHDLIERLEKATGPDRQLDNAIEAAVDLPKPTNPDDDLPGYPPYFTASIDAALTLVPKGWGGICAIGTNPSLFTQLWKGTKGKSLSGQGGRTPAIALCIAALKARAA